jgi:cysteine desulfurase / selenocysteine lyase
MSLDTDLIKKDFPIFENYINEWGHELVFLDSAASSQTPKQVIDAMNEYYFHYRSNVHRSPYRIGLKASELYEKSRQITANYIGAEEWEVIFTSNATASSNTLALALGQSLKISANDEIVVSIADHHSNFLPFQELAIRTGAKIKVIPLSKTNLAYDSALELISSKTKIVTISYGSNVLGTIFDVKKIIEKAHQVGAVAIIDATTTVGHIPVDVKSLDCDFLYFSGHKMLGPTGVGVLYGKEEVLTKLHPSIVGGGTIESVSITETRYRDIPMRFEAGTPNIAGAIGLGQAISYIENLGMNNIHTHIDKIADYAMRKLSELKHVTLLSETGSKNCGIVSFVVNNMHSHSVANKLDKYHISIRAGHHCSMPLANVLGIRSLCRASFYIYNSEADVDKLTEAIQSLK